MIPDWYRGFRHDAFHELLAKNKVWAEEFKTKSCPRYYYDLEAGELTFSDEAGVRVRADIQVVGTTSNEDWLWSWGNPSMPEDLTVDARATREFGLEHAIDELTVDYVEADDLNDLGWGLTAVTAKVTGAIGAYRPPGSAGAMFLLIRSIAWAKPNG